jgi:regulator of protease activity HflC (stomatin/prohibitin superfamily)
VEPKVPKADELGKEFRSFYSKRHLREAAVGKHRRSGRSSSAWGQPVPDVTQRDFELPEEYRDKETLQANARRKRRDRRVSKES